MLWEPYGSSLPRFPSHTVRLTLVAWSVPKCRRVRHWLIACGPLYCTAIKRATAGPRCRSSVHTLVTL